MRTFFVIAPVASVLMFGTFLLCCSEARAEEPSPVRYGVTMGLNMGKLIWPETWMADVGRDDRLSQPKMRFGLVAEFFTANPAISVVTGIDYRMTREKYHYYIDGVGLWTDRMGTFLTVPALFKYNFNKITGMWPFFELGPQAAFLLSFTGKDDAPGRPAGSPAAIPMEMTQYTRRVSLELRGGAGIEFPMSGMFTGVIETGYDYGLTSIIIKSLNNPTTARNLFFSMGARF